MVVRGVRAALVAVLVAVAWAGPAHAVDPAFQARLAPDAIVFGGEAPSGRLTVRTGAEAETFRVTMAITGRGYDGGGSVLGLGCPQPRIEGPGSIGPTNCAVPSPVPPCHRTYLPTEHGSWGGHALFEVTVPAGSESTVVVPLHHAHTAPWADARYAMRFTASGGTLEADREVDTPELAPAGRTGVRLSVALDPGGDTLCGKVPELPNGPVTVTGRSDPALPGQEILLRYATADEPQPRDLARVGVREDGTFQLRDWRPASGHYEVAATYVAQRPERADDFSRPVAFTMRAPGPVVPPPPPPPPPVVTAPRSVASLLTRRVRVGAGGAVRLRVACPAAAAKACAGRLRLRARARTLAARRLTVVAGARRVVHLRLNRYGRRLLRRAGRVRVTVRLGPAAAGAVVLVRR